MILDSGLLFWATLYIVSGGALNSILTILTHSCPGVVLRILNAVSRVTMQCFDQAVFIKV